MPTTTEECLARIAAIATDTSRSAPQRLEMVVTALLEQAVLNDDEERWVKPLLRVDDSDR